MDGRFLSCEKIFATPLTKSESLERLVSQYMSPYEFWSCGQIFPAPLSLYKIQVCLGYDHEKASILTPEHEF